MKKRDYYQLWYHCGECNKLRCMFVPKALKRSNSRGYVEYIDLHSCNGQKTANLLYVDSHYVVRSQSVLKPHVSVIPKMEQEETALFSIPKPAKKNTLAESTIHLPYSASMENIHSITIIHNTKDEIYKLANHATGNHIIVKSSLEHITIDLFFNSNLDYTQVELWLEKVANDLESLVVFDEKVLDFLTMYLDKILSQPFDIMKAAELETLIKGGISVIRTEESIIADFKQSPDQYLLEIEHVKMYQLFKVLNKILEKKMNLFDLYQDLNNELADYSVCSFMENLSALLISGLVNIVTLQFFQFN